MTTAEHSSRWARRFVAAGVVFLVCWQIAVLADVDSSAGIVLGLLGFVFHTIFGKAYSLVPTYFDRELGTTRFMPLHLALSVGGVALLAAGLEAGEPDIETVGAALWLAAVGVFVCTIGWTIRTNPTGRETATGEHNAERRPVDRAANAFVPVALAYLVVGSYELLATGSGLPTILDGYPPRAIHLLAAGSGALVVFTVGFRLLPRFLVAAAPRPLVGIVLPAGALGPALLAADMPDGALFRAGAVLEAVAVAGFALAVWIMYVRSDRRRVGFHAVLASAAAGVVGVGLGLTFAFDASTIDLVAIHRRVNVLGFLGLLVVGVSYQFYPPAVADFPGGGDRTALAAILAIAAGLVVEAVGVYSGEDVLLRTGQVAALVGALLHGYLLFGLFRQRFG